ncbi:MAG TPA: hypothetical protein PK225_05555 [Azonexus sp.]|jgi:hypothetical protein|nr:hypothetical protein [Azonexus sp.]
MGSNSFRLQLGVAQFRHRYQVEVEQSRWIEATALSALKQVTGGLPSATDQEFLARATSGGFSLELPGEWLEEDPWTAAALGDEGAAWKALGLDYVVKSRPARWTS